LQLRRFENKLLLYITDNCVIEFKTEWAEHLRSLPIEQFGDFLKDVIYPALSREEQKLWNQVQISNPELNAAIQALS
jgi:hypothetical protein